MAAICLGFHPSFTMKKRRGRRWWTCPDINVRILTYWALVTLRARTTDTFMEWILWAPQKDSTLQAHLCLQKKLLSSKEMNTSNHFSLQYLQPPYFHPTVFNCFHSLWLISEVWWTKGHVYISDASLFPKHYPASTGNRSPAFWKQAKLSSLELHSQSARGSSATAYICFE